MDFVRLGRQTDYMPRIAIVTLLVLGVSLLGAQDPPKGTPQAGKTAHLPLIDPAKLAGTISESYYHPDELTGLDCAVALDWPAFFKALKLEVPEDRLKVIEALKIHAHATRTEPAELTFDWGEGQPGEPKDQLESGLRQMVSGFFQMYWPMLAGSPVPVDTKFSKVEPQDDGTTKASASDASGSIEIVLDHENVPTHYAVDNPAMKVGMTPHYTPSPQPAPGDLRRVTEMDVVEQIGANNISLNVSVDYQPLDTFFVPKNVKFDIVGAYSITMAFSECSASKK